MEGLLIDIDKRRTGGTVVKSTGRVPRYKMEVCGSFNYKHFDGDYKSRDFFHSAKAECWSDEAEAMAEKLHEFCKKMVLRELNAWIEQLNKQRLATEAKKQQLGARIDAYARKA